MYEFSFWTCRVQSPVRWPSRDFEDATEFMIGSSEESLGWRHKFKSHQHIDNNLNHKHGRDHRGRV